MQARVLRRILATSLLVAITERRAVGVVFLHRLAKGAQFLLALILIARQDTEGGAAVLHSYLAGSPDPRDVDNAKNILGRMQPYAAK
jgi:hypothetical protein